MNDTAHAALFGSVLVSGGVTYPSSNSSSTSSSEPDTLRRLARHFVLPQYTMKARESRTPTCSPSLFPFPCKPSSPLTPQIQHSYPLPYYCSPSSPSSHSLICYTHISVSIFKTPLAHDDTPFSFPHLRHFHLFPALKRYNVVQKLEQGSGPLEVSVLFLTNVRWLLCLFLTDFCVEFGECIACRDVSDGPGLLGRHGYHKGI